ncbi:MAG: NAD(P)/FAD-dependent oxidoreductase [Flavobacteriaceae bacterium]|nr:NAD(P)/FAD-dependent oxidoreductase [Flavobacteriaceae bacterium]
MNIPEIDLQRVVIIGGGFAGLNLAKKLNKNHYQVVLLDKNNYHTFQPLLYQVATSGLEPDSIAYPIRRTFKNAANFHFRVTEVYGINATEKTVNTSTGALRYDYFVIATGAKTNFFGMDSLENNSISMKSLVESLDLRSKIIQNFEKALYTKNLKEQEALMNFIIVGAGPTGVELAGALAELKNHVLPKDYPDLDIRRMKIHLVEAAPRILAPMSEVASKKAHEFLKKLGVHIWTNTLVTDYDGTLVTTNGKTDFYSETLIWAAGVKGNPVEGLSEENITRGNRIEVNDFLEVAGKESVFAMGDVALVHSNDTPNGHAMLGSVAMQQGIHLANNFNRLVLDKKRKPFVYNDKGTMATVGRNLAVVDLPKFKFQGFFAWFVWMFVHLMLLVGFRNKVIVFINWAWSYIRFDKGTRLIVRPYKE